GNDDRQRVPAERLRHGARRGGLTKLARDARIGPHGAVGDARRRLEHGTVELAPREPQVERPLEPGAPALDVLEKISVQRVHLDTRRCHGVRVADGGREERGLDLLAHGRLACHRSSLPTGSSYPFRLRRILRRAWNTWARALSGEQARLRPMAS